MPATYAVFTGDLIGSTRESSAEVDLAMEALDAEAAEIGRWVGESARFTRFRGDGWQLYLEKPASSLRAMLALIAHLSASKASLQTRIAIGFGPVERLGTSDLSDATGEAFSLSGHALDGMPRGSRITLADSSGLASWHAALFDLAFWTASRWTPDQAEAVSMALDPTARTQAEIAQMLSVSRQAVQQRLSSAGWDPLLGAIEAVREHWEGEDDG